MTEEVGETWRDKTSIHWLACHMFTTARPGPEQSHEPGTLSSSPSWMAGTLVLTSYPLLISRELLLKRSSQDLNQQSKMKCKCHSVDLIHCDGNPVLTSCLKSKSQPFETRFCQPMNLFLHLSMLENFIFICKENRCIGVNY